MGVLSNSTPRLVQKNLSKIKAFSNLGKSIDFELDLSFLNLATIDRTLEVATKAESRILLDLNKIKYSLFWFQDVSTFDSVALSNLVKGDTNKAIEIWNKMIKSSAVNSKNFSAFNNVSSLLFLLSLDNYKTDRFKNDNESFLKLEQAINYKLKLINSSFFEAYCESLGVKSSINSDEILIYFSETILEIIQQNFESDQIKNLVKEQDPVFTEMINMNLVKGPISNLKDQINLASNSLDDAKNAILIGKSLIKNTVSDLKYLKQTLGENHFQYAALADKVSNQILQCGIVCFNKTENDQSYLSSYKYALSIASSEKTKTRAKDCIKHCEEDKLANICWFCEKNQISPDIYYRFQMHKWDKSSPFNFNRTYTYFKNGGLKLGCCKSCRDRHTEIVFTTIYYYFKGIFKGIKRPAVKSSTYSSLRRHPLVLKHIREGYEPGLPN